MIHLSSRLAWHDSGWNGRVCQQPHLNASCIANQVIRKQRNAPNDFRLPDFTIGYMGDVYYWEHLGMLSLPTYREGWERKRKWYEERLGFPVVGPGGRDELDLDAYYGPIVIASAENEDGGMDVPAIEQLARKYILQE